MFDEWDEPFYEEEYRYLQLRMEAEWMEWEYYNSVPLPDDQKTDDSEKNIPESDDILNIKKKDVNDQ